MMSEAFFMNLNISLRFNRFLTLKLPRNDVCYMIKLLYEMILCRVSR